MLLRRAGVARAYSKTALLAIALSLAAAVSLGQNYTASLIPGVNDGIGISNRFAYWIIGEGQWSVGRFRTMFEWSIAAVLLLIAAYPLVAAAEARLARQTQAGE